MRRSAPTRRSCSLASSARPGLRAATARGRARSTDRSAGSRSIRAGRTPCWGSTRSKGWKRSTGSTKRGATSWCSARFTAACYAELSRCARRSARTRSGRRLSPSSPARAPPSSCAASTVSTARRSSTSSRTGIRVGAPNHNRNASAVSQAASTFSASSGSARVRPRLTAAIGRPAAAAHSAKR